MSIMSSGTGGEKLRVELVFGATDDAAKRIGRVYSILINAALRSDPSSAVDEPEGPISNERSGGRGGIDNSKDGN